MYKALIETIASQSSCSTEELEEALHRLNSIDALIVSIEYAYVTEQPFMQAVQDIQMGQLKEIASPASFGNQSM